MAGALAIRRVGDISLGSSWSIYSFPGFSAQRVTNDVFFGWGPWHAAMLSAAGALCDAIVTSGYPAGVYVDEFIERGEAIRRRASSADGSKVICLYDNAFARDGEYCTSSVLDFIGEILSWVADHRDVSLIIKSKREEFIHVYPQPVRSLLKTLEDSGRLLYEHKRGDLAPGFASDLTIGIGLATLPCLLASIGKDVMLLDANRFHEQAPSVWGNIRFVVTPPDVVAALDAWMEHLDRGPMHPLKTAVETNANSAGSLDDEKASERIGSYMRCILSFLSDGMDGQHAVDKANKTYRERWGIETMITDPRSGCIDQDFADRKEGSNTRRYTYA